MKNFENWFGKFSKVTFRAFESWVSTKVVNSQYLSYSYQLHYDQILITAVIKTKVQMGDLLVP